MCTSIVCVHTKVNNKRIFVFMNNYINFNLYPHPDNFLGVCRQNIFNQWSNCNAKIIQLCKLARDLGKSSKKGKKTKDLCMH